MGQFTRENIIIITGLFILLAIPVVASAATTQLHIVKYADDGTTILGEQTVTYQWMEANLPVFGDGVTHYYHQGPVFVDNADPAVEQQIRWNPEEDANVQEKDMGAVKGTNLKDLCNLVGGMSAGEEVKMVAADGWNMRFGYKNVYQYSSREGPIVLCWYRAGQGYVPSYYEGIRMIWFADTGVNPWGIHAFGNYDWHEAADSGYWYYYMQGTERYPTTTGLSGQVISEIQIFSDDPVPPAGSITLSSPNGGESWAQGSVQTVRWTYTGSPGTQVRIELWKNRVYNSLIAPSAPIGTGGTGSFAWTVPAGQTVGSDYRVKVFSTGSAAITDLSNANFAITAASSSSITVTAPNGGEQWQRSTTRTITWTYTGSPGSYVKAELFKGGVLNRVIKSNTSIGSGGTGSCTWAISSGQTLGNDYTVKVTSLKSSLYTDSSNTAFSIVAPVTGIIVTVPNGGEQWQQGTSHTVAWTYSGSFGSYVKIELYKGGILNRVIKANTSLGSMGSGSYAWTVSPTQTPGNDYTVKVTSLKNAAYSDVSNANFAIVSGGGGTGTLTLTAPNGGENWARNTKHTITWTYTGTPGSTVRIELWKNKVYNSLITASTSLGSGGAGSYSWTVPAGIATGSDYRVKIFSGSSGTITDLSNANFIVS